jgi:hypothetical protein
MNNINELKQQCYDLGKSMPNKVPHETVMQMLAKVIVEKKIHDDDAFDMASQAYAEGFNGLDLGVMSS